MGPQKSRGLRDPERQILYWSAIFLQVLGITAASESLAYLFRLRNRPQGKPPPLPVTCPRQIGAHGGDGAFHGNFSLGADPEQRFLALRRAAAVVVSEIGCLWIEFSPISDPNTKNAIVHAPGVSTWACLRSYTHVSPNGDDTTR